MSQLIERLYRNTQKEISAGLIVQERILLTIQLGAAAVASQSAIFAAVPLGKIRVITDVGFSAVPGAAQTLLYAVAQINATAAGVYQTWVPHQTGIAAATLVPGGRTFGEGLILRGGEVFLLATFFNAGVAANSTNAWISGYEIPVGNIL